MSKHLPVGTVGLTDYERAYATEQGATKEDMEELEFECTFPTKADDSTDYDGEPPAHDATCDCTSCERDLFDGQMDENNDGGALVRQQWRAGIELARISKAEATLGRREQWIRDTIRLAKERRIEAARRLAKQELIKKSYVHVPGTSSWLQYGQVPTGLIYRLKKQVPSVKHVDSYVRIPQTGVLTCRLHVQWPLPRLEPARADAHFRLLLEQSGFTPATQSEVTLVTWSGK